MPSKVPDTTPGTVFDLWEGARELQHRVDVAYDYLPKGSPEALATDLQDARHFLGCAVSCLKGAYSMLKANE